MFLLPERDNIEQAIRSVYRVIFEEMLQASVNDPELWPEKRDLRTFRKWFEVQVVAMVFDADRGEVVDDAP